MRAYKLTFAALAVTAGLSLTACQNDVDGKGPSSPSPASTGSSASPSGSVPGSGGSANRSGGKGAGGKGTTAGTGSGTTGKVARCRTDELETTAKDGTIDGDPDGTVTVRLENRGGRDCAISGYAGVDLKTDSGSLSAKRTGEHANPAVLKNGASTAFGINYPLNKSGGSGVRVTGLLVTPPNETKTVALAWPGAATLPVTDGTGTPVKVGPVGNAGQGG
ncbi:DUF4232 domain-containing protein [Streptomyces sp. NBC_00728]|uniref:DUF4232 domain-containing protein n=1 Tax=Streptomyces sp. NBC_00728 TaxID=2903676 RepID=UPI003865179D